MRSKLAGITAILVIGSAASLASGGGKKEKKDGPLAHEWRVVAGKHWQIATEAGEAPSVTDTREGNRGACTEGMIEIRGKYKVAGNGDYLQQSICKKWINRDFPERCAEFDRDKWLALSSKLPTRDMHFCIDRFEYPNRKGEYPVILVDWHEAIALCKEQNKRICTEDEWTFACEGEEGFPYPYGYVRDPDACIVDRAWRPFVSSWALYGRASEQAKRELDGLWQGVASGSQPKCKSTFGVYDMIGNIDEWTRSSRSGRQSILKGGYWGPVRTRCRPTTRAHGETHVFYQEGVRCCSDLGK
jgi:hypothetical protein